MILCSRCYESSGQSWNSNLDYAYRNKNTGKISLDSSYHYYRKINRQGWLFTERYRSIDRKDHPNWEEIKNPYKEVGVPGHFKIYARGIYVTRVELHYDIAPFTIDIINNSKIESMLFSKDKVTHLMAIELIAHELKEKYKK